jgi:uncharacterized protein (DUF58 family)
VTTRGRTLLVLAITMFGIGRLAGMRELIMMGAALGLVLVVGAAAIWVRAGTISVARSIRPAVTVAGRPVRVELSLRASGHLGAGPVLLTDEIPPRIGNDVRLSLAAGRRERSVAYTFTPRLRGKYAIGPVTIVHTDPFGAVKRTQKLRGSSPLLVYPSYEDIAALPSGVHRLGVIRHSPLVGQGDEFYALRAYEEGDDLRKVHWPSSLRTGELVIRQEELLAEPVALIVLDTCAGKHAGRGAAASIEAAISAAASVGVLAIRRRMRVGIATPDGPLLPVRRPTEHQLLEALATLRPSRRRDMAAGVEQSVSRTRPAVTVVISPGLDTVEVKAVALRSHGTASGAVILVDAPSYAPGSRVRRTPSAHDALAFPVAMLSAGKPFAEVWQEVVRHAALAR